MQITDPVTIYYSVSSLSGPAYDEWLHGKTGDDDEGGDDAPTSSAAAPAGGKGPKTAPGSASASAPAAPAPLSVALASGEVLPVQSGPRGAQATGDAVTAVIAARMFGAVMGAGFALPPSEASEAQAAWVSSSIVANYGLIRGTLRVPFLPDTPSTRPSSSIVVASAREVVSGVSLTLTIAKTTVAFPASDEALVAAATAAGAADAATVARTARATLAARDPARVAAEASASGGVLKLAVDGTTLALHAGVHFYPAGAVARFTAAGKDGDAARAALAAELGAELAEKLGAALAKF